jgi:hypothetical protein
MSSDRKITIIKQSDCGKMQTDRLARLQSAEKRKAELKKIKDELLTLARRVEELEEVEAA